jgi:uncharacterized protein (DUF111 family)
MTIDSIGCGAGTLDSEHLPNILRLIIGEAADESSANADSIALLETNIDDVTGEVVGCTMNGLLDAGALDVWTSPIIMKHSRPAVMLSVICSIADIDKIEQLIFEAGLTFGIRKQIIQRSKLARSFVSAATPFGKIRIKVGRWNGKVVNVKPELADCIKAAQKHKVSIKKVIDAAMASSISETSKSISKKYR